MGRTLHYGFGKNPRVQVTEKDWERIDKLTDAYNKDYKWTCDNVDLSPVDYFPRWPSWFSDSGLPKKRDPKERTGFASAFDDGVTGAWEVIDVEYEKNKKKGLTRIQNVKDLLDRKLVAIMDKADRKADEINLQSCGSFTKVAGNEFNALLVVGYLTECSKILPKHTFSVYDEGEFLTGAILIKNGKAKLDRLYNKGQLPYWEKSLKEAGEKRKSFWQDLISAKEILLAKYPVGKLYPVKEFCRPVNPKDFDDHPQFKGICMDIKGNNLNSGGSQIMAGFEGEYYGKVSQTEAAWLTLKANKYISGMIGVLCNDPKIKSIIEKEKVKKSIKESEKVK